MSDCSTMGADALSSTVEVTDDLFLGGALRIRQPKTGYRAGLDAVLLAAACPTGMDPARCLDCGAGAGVAGLAAARRIANLSVTLIERDPALAAMAASNIAANQLGDRCKIVQADLTRPLAEIAALAPQAGQFDHVLANPPYHAHGRGTRAADPLKDGSHAMAAGAFDEWARFAAGMLRNGGSFTIIQRPDALAEILAALARRFGRVRILPLHARAGKSASRLLIQSIKGSRAGLEVLPGRVLHVTDQHAFTEEFDTILRHGAPLTIT